MQKNFPFSAMTKPNLVRTRLSSSNRFLDWWENQGGGKEFCSLFDQFDNVVFFAKDEDGRLVVLSEKLARKIAEKLGLKSTAEIRGLTDYDLHPREIAEKFVADDRLVMTTGQPLLNRVEMGVDPNNQLSWTLTTKVPVRDQAGNVIGIIGTVRSYNWNEDHVQQHSLINTIISFIQRHHRNQLTIQQIADEAGLSVRHLNRTFQKAFSISVQEFLIRQRLQTVKTALSQTNDPISSIAVESGFSDQSSMTKLFRKYIGMTPLKYRKAYATR